MTDVREYRIEFWRARKIGWHWYVRSYLNGRRDPTVPESYPWALTMKAAVRRASKHATDRALERGVGLIEVGSSWPRLPLP